MGEELLGGRWHKGFKQQLGKVGEVGYTPDFFLLERQFHNVEVLIELIHLVYVFLLHARSCHAQPTAT